MKVLLTGPCGRIGFALLPELLKAGHQVRCFDTRDAFLSHEKGFNESVERYFKRCGHKYEWIWGDIRNAEDVTQAITPDIDVVIHHAAMTLPSHCEEEQDYCRAVNYQGTLNVIGAIEKAGSRAKLLYSSSVACYGYPPEDEQAFKESDALVSTCTYAETKINSEAAIAQSPLNYTIFRMASVMDFPSPHFNMVASGQMDERIDKENQLKSPTSEAHLVSTSDVSAAYIQSMDNADTDREIFNLAGSDSSCRGTFRSYMDELLDGMGGKITEDADWGQGPYPQFYYDTSKIDAVLNCTQTPWPSITKSVSASVKGMPSYIIRSSSSPFSALKAFWRIAAHYVRKLF